MLVVSTHESMTKGSSLVLVTNVNSLNTGVNPGSNKLVSCILSLPSEGRS